MPKFQITDKLHILFTLKLLLIFKFSYQALFFLNGAEVEIGSLDNALEIKPNAHLFISSKANWENDLESVQAFERLPS